MPPSCGAGMHAAAYNWAIPCRALAAVLLHSLLSCVRCPAGAKSFMYVPPGAKTLAQAVMKAPTGEPHVAAGSP
jgi:hypothetical protein